MNENEMTKNTARMWLVIFPGTLLAILVAFLFCMKHPASTENENRNPVTWQEVLDAPVGERTEVFESWFNDRFPLRNEFIESISMIEFFVFDDSASSQIIRGKNGWCFFRGDDDYCIHQYKGLEGYSDKTVDEIVENLTRTRDYLEEKNIDFVIMVVPGKQRIYSEYMPSHIKIVDDECNTDEVISAIRERTDLKLIWLEEDFEKYKEKNPSGPPLYFKLESHWNKFGAFVGTSRLLSELGIKKYDNDDFSVDGLAERGINVTRDKQTNLDLPKLMNLSSVLSDMAYFVDGYSDKDPDIDKGDEAGDREVITSLCPEAEDGRTVYVYGDSFSRYMMPYLGCEFAKVYRNDDIDARLLSEVKPDVVVLQVVERNIGRFDDIDVMTEHVPLEEETDE